METNNIVLLTCVLQCNKSNKVFGYEKVGYIYLRYASDFFFKRRNITIYKFLYQIKYMSIILYEQGIEEKKVLITFYNNYVKEKFICNQCTKVPLEKLEHELSIEEVTFYLVISPNFHSFLDSLKLRKYINTYYSMLLFIEALKIMILQMDVHIQIKIIKINSERQISFRRSLQDEFLRLHAKNNKQIQLTLSYLFSPDAFA